VLTLFADGAESLWDELLRDSSPFGGDSGGSSPFAAAPQRGRSDGAPGALWRGHAAGLCGQPGASRALVGSWGVAWGGKRQPPPPIGPGRSIAPDGRAVTERSEGKGASDLDSTAAGATMIQVQGGGRPGRA
jgi:hypothetical protein